VLNERDGPWAVTCETISCFCGSYGYCENGSCVCESGYTGPTCEECSDSQLAFPNCADCGTHFFPKDITYIRDSTISTTDVGSSTLDKSGEIHLHSATIAATNQIIEMEIVYFCVLRVEVESSVEVKLYKGASS
jgi:hypothetical protein